MKAQKTEFDVIEDVTDLLDVVAEFTGLNKSELVNYAVLAAFYKFHDRLIACSCSDDDDVVREGYMEVRNDIIDAVKSAIYDDYSRED